MICSPGIFVFYHQVCKIVAFVFAAVHHGCCLQVISYVRIRPVLHQNVDDFI